MPEDVKGYHLEGNCERFAPFPNPTRHIRPALSVCAGSAELETLIKFVSRDIPSWYVHKCNSIATY